MTTAFQIPIPSTFSDLGRTRAATASLEMLNAMSKPSTAEKYFGESCTYLAVQQGIF